jgi:hypothetical protein
MIELSIFIAMQLVLNFIIHVIANNKVAFLFTNLAILIFGILITVYPMWSWRIYDFFYPSDANDNFRCGNMLMGAAMFQWIVGTPLVIILQWFLNKYLRKSRINA